MLDSTICSALFIACIYSLFRREIKGKINARLRMRCIMYKMVHSCVWTGNDRTITAAAKMSVLLAVVLLYAVAASAKPDCDCLGFGPNILTKNGIWLPITTSYACIKMIWFGDIDVIIIITCIS